MNYIVEKMGAMSMIGYEADIPFDDAYQTIPTLWKQFSNRRRLQTAAAHEEMCTIESCKIGEFGICRKDISGGTTFHYMIAGRHNGCPAPEGMKILEVPELEWAKFHCIGPLPSSLQTVNTRIFKEWLPGNPDYEIAMDINIEWYSCSDCSLPDYESEIWIPVKRRQAE